MQRSASTPAPVPAKSAGFSRRSQNDNRGRGLQVLMPLIELLGNARRIVRVVLLRIGLVAAVAMGGEMTMRRRVGRAAVRGGLPELRADECFRAVAERFIDRHHKYCARRLALHEAACEQRRI